MIYFHDIKEHLKYAFNTLCLLTGKSHPTIDFFFQKDDLMSISDLFPRYQRALKVCL
jgi:hypothetical protein